MSDVDATADRTEAAPEPVEPAGPQPRARPAKKPGGQGPFVVIGIALAGGLALAKFVDWRGHAHPRW